MRAHAVETNGKNALAFWLGILVPASAGVIAIGGLIWQVANVAFQVVAVTASVAQINSRVDQGHSDVAKLQIEMAANKTALNEVETQFCSSDIVRNLIHANDQRLMALVWSKVSPNERLPTDNSYYPTICNRNAVK